MLPCSVYSPAMQMNARPALLQRIGRLLRAKEFLVFYAIGLGLLDVGAPLATGWLFRHRSLATLLHTNNTVAGDALTGRGVALVAVAVAYLLVSAFFTAGYLRSLLGRLHWGPRDARQFARLFALLALGAVVSWGAAALESAAGHRLGSTGLQLLVFAVATLVNVPLLYAGYAIVASNVGVTRAIVRSLRTFAANAFDLAARPVRPVLRLPAALLAARSAQRGARSPWDPSSSSTCSSGAASASSPTWCC